MLIKGVVFTPQVRLVIMEIFPINIYISFIPQLLKLFLQLCKGQEAKIWSRGLLMKTSCLWFLELRSWGHRCRRSHGARSVVDDNLKRVIESAGDPIAGIYIGQKVSLAIQCGNAASILGTSMWVIYLAVSALLSLYCKFLFLFNYTSKY